MSDFYEELKQQRASLQSEYMKNGEALLNYKYSKPLFDLFKYHSPRKAYIELYMIFCGEVRFVCAWDIKSPKGNIFYSLQQIEKDEECFMCAIWTEEDDHDPFSIFFLSASDAVRLAAFLPHAKEITGIQGKAKDLLGDFLT